MRSFLPLALSLLVLLGTSWHGADAAITLPKVFGSSMVLQRNAPIFLRGTDTPGATLSISFAAQEYPASADPTTGAWTATLPQQASGTFTITISSNKSPAVVLADVAIGDVVVCSGQSNMELGVIATVNQSEVLAEAGAHGDRIRILQVATLAQYYNVSTPQDDFTVSVPWSRVNENNLAYFSAMCYWYARTLIDSEPDVVFGLVDSSWGGTAIEPWMDPASLQACGEGVTPVSRSQSSRLRAQSNPDPGSMHARVAKGSADVHLKDGPPSLPSTLYNSMIAPLIKSPISALLWYQGESNCGNPTGYAKCFPAFINGWRRLWSSATHGATDVNLPFFFVQLSSWPAGDNGLIATQRFAQETALALPKVAMVVAADIGDPGSPFHPIHPPWKAEVGRRTALAASNIVYGHTDVTTAGPKLSEVYLDAWQASWGEYHMGIGSGVCSPGSGFFCMGVRLVFDQPVGIQASYGRSFGFPSGFELLSGNAVSFMPAILTGSAATDKTVVQLNATWTFGDLHSPPAVLRYAWHDYPVMYLANNQGQPVAPFNVTLPAPGSVWRVED